MEVRADQVGKRTWVLKDVQAEAGMGRVDGRGFGVLVLRVKGLVVDGVRRALRRVEMESSIVLRERRRKSGMVQMVRSGAYFWGGWWRDEVGSVV